MSLFLVVAGAWIYRTEHDWADAVYVSNEAWSCVATHATSESHAA
jgi:hypothetical protein